MELFITAVIPAHNESVGISKAIKSLKKQVNQVLVACDNCTDDTFEQAIKAGATAFKTEDNQNRKAGALNQALEHYINWDKVNECDFYLFICDADTIIVDDWVDRAKKEIYLGSRDGYDAVGSVFYGNANRKSMVEFCQQVEWYRYTNQIERTKKVFVLTGTASLISAKMLLKVKKSRGHFYDENSITEDFTLTVELKEEGARLISPVSCKCTTEIMPSWKMLFLQRRRWYLGALHEVLNHRWSKSLLPYVFQQMMLILSVFSFFGSIIFSAFLMIENKFIFNWFWILIGILFVFERVITVANQDKETKLFAALLFPELIYSAFLQLAFIGALIQYLTGSKGTWDHV
ncbi:glycosyltransferase family 2 protein [Pediococcus claussenii]|uniref:Glycosyl transferase 2 family protein n=1 Tax=Pediococcus claussenii (strain ATCC BAA-344 / DSM 14800 / JCM 18046 / KCTC 3811 / LMG 21948 / P06) TaxID=701521 RepID=G8PEU9_PEDCP|nr:glycosyltransferase family 2 protein [Pediococcus claussenii]AEV94479.1 glycosyl transferase 2 family protein [Pediococcus claussenii ATCC BAA-344]ANZ69697.1 glycosyl transferase [Pediococcus claussenii]ANZ71514.1 glycosyl transferase [Pediococcus claussenii]KRN19814.1 hypothetical protein IV79_GL001102 [Pediococcus claussenii]